MPEPLPNDLVMIHGNKPEDLCDLLVAWMKRYPLAPLENEVVLVQSNGIAQWMKLAMAADPSRGLGGCGIAAGIETSLPSNFLWRAYREVLGSERVPKDSPFDKRLLTWRLMRLLPALIERPEYAPLQSFLSEDDGLRKRFQLAERLADLFDQYQVYRADWLDSWAKNRDILTRGDGREMPLPDASAWQPLLWRDLLADVRGTDGGEAVHHGRAAVHAAFLQKVQCWGGAARPAKLPRRISVFGISSMPRQSLEVLAALAQWSQVILCVHNPCEYDWADIVTDKDLLRPSRRRQVRKVGMPPAVDASMLHLHAHPLLAAWGKQGRDFIALLDEHDSESRRVEQQKLFEAMQRRMDLFSAHGRDVLLHQLQEDIRELCPVPPTDQPRPTVAPDDTSICFHVTHGPQREVEILQDQLLAAFNADPTLRPRDVIVMVPDIEQYVPLIRAVFGLIDKSDPRYIPFNIVDHGRRSTEPLVSALEKLLNLPTSRIGVGDVLDLIEVPAIRKRYSLEESNVPVLRRWIRGANIRWGLDAEHRQFLGLGAELEENTWHFGMRRMLLGYAAGTQSEAWHSIDSYDEIGGLDAVVLGSLASLIDDLQRTWTELQQAAPVSIWCERLGQLLTTFFVPEDDRELYTLQQMRDALQDWEVAATAAGLVGDIPLSVVAPYWLAQVDEEGLARTFFAGAVTFATLMPMRAIPFSHVCLLGMNDGDYPRSRVPMDFDLMAMSGQYRPGDRSRREDDRYLFLEALLSARKHLHISWVGRSINDNSPRPPSVLVGQLRDHLAAGWTLARGHGAKGELLQALTVEHRLQPFNPDYFPEDPTTSRLFSYAAEWCRAGKATQGDNALPLRDRSEPLTVLDLTSFLKDPVKYFYNQRLKVNFETEDPSSDDLEPFELDGLGVWQLQSEMILAAAREVESGDSGEAAVQHMAQRIGLRGDLPARAFGTLMMDDLMVPIADQMNRYRESLGKWPHPAKEAEEVLLHVLGEETSLVIQDWLHDIRTSSTGQRGRIILETSSVIKGNRYQYSKLLRHWVAHLAAHCAGGPLTSVIVSRAGNAELQPLKVKDAEAHLRRLIAAWLEGQRRPLPLEAEAACAWIAAKDPDRALGDAKTIYEGGFKISGSLERNPYLQRTYPDFAALVASGEFQKLAAELIKPLIEACAQQNAKSTQKKENI